MFRRRILPFLIWAFYRLLSGSWRKVYAEHPDARLLIDQQQTFIFAHWHGDELALVHMVKPYQLATMTSTSGDGQLMDSVIKRLGGATSRGSSTRGGVSALKGLIRLMKGGRRASMAVDGPKGPIYQVKPGVFELSRLAKAPVVPIVAVAAKAHVFEKSWNKTFLPLPFAKVVIHIGQPWPTIEREDNPKDPKWAKRLALELHDAKQQASKIIAGI